MRFLEDLTEDLEGTLHVIAHAGQEGNLPYIRSCQEYFRDRYDRFLEYVVSDVEFFHIMPAYDALQDLLVGDPTPKEVIERCETALAEYLIPSDEYAGVFEDFYREEDPDPPQPPLIPK
ncbi:MAG: hypothetical protein ACTSWQ_07035 [Candidatus Thorarchaeota archaeon]